MTDFANKYMPLNFEKGWLKENPGFPLSIPLKAFFSNGRAGGKTYKKSVVEKVTEKGITINEAWCMLNNKHLKEADSISVKDAAKYIKESFLNNWT